ncbi:hypothetical protein GRJ2_001222500 [Grus japonensis]|uniref:Uncharacterized protein n=1 Tax=Grus japonensis TaxID=30415 RepID=A0ABC9WSL9_GRUJA
MATRSQKVNGFVFRPTHEKTITEVDGIDEELGVKLADEGFEKPTDTKGTPVECGTDLETSSPRMDSYGRLHGSVAPSPEIKAKHLTEDVVIQRNPATWKEEEPCNS